MRIRNNRIIIINILVYILFIFIGRNLDLYKQNYSTLSLETRGYLCLLVTGIILGLLLGYETTIISNKRNGVLMLFGLIVGVLIPHHVPYNFQGNMHLLFAYTSAFITTILTYINIYRFNNINTVFVLLVVLSIITYMKYMMVTGIGEIILMSSIMICNLWAYIKTSRT